MLQILMQQRERLQKGHDLEIQPLQEKRSMNSIAPSHRYLEEWLLILTVCNFSVNLFHVKKPCLY